MNNKSDNLKSIALFESREIRRIWNNERWYFSLADTVYALTDSNDVKQYIKKMRDRDAELSSKWGTICTPLDTISKDGKKRLENMADIEGIFRIIQSIPSPKAEPFKRWLAHVGKERIDEIRDPELAVNRAKAIYEKKGYPRDWIDKRLRGINVRNTLTDEWKSRGLKAGMEFAILPMLGEATTTRLTKERDSGTFHKMHKDAKEGGEVAGKTRVDIESRVGKKIVSKKNYLPKKRKGGLIG